MTKNKFFLFFLLFLIHVSQAFAQTDNAYRNALNPHYWKNRKPHAGYWQQDVAYKIEASINERSNVLEATEELTYWNNSPHTLEVVYFHHSNPVLQ
jgi:aminopeptidase N